MVGTALRCTRGEVVPVDRTFAHPTSFRLKQRGVGRALTPPTSLNRFAESDVRAQIPNSSFIVRVVVAIDCAFARSSSLPFGDEKPCPVPLYTSYWNGSLAPR